MNTVDLINNLLKRSDGALDELKLHYGPLIRYVISPILPDERDREEVFSDILIRVWDRVGQFDPNHGSWTNWLSTIARNAAIDRARRNPPINSELTETIPAPNSDPEQELLHKERQKALTAPIPNRMPLMYCCSQVDLGSSSTCSCSSTITSASS